MPSVRRVLARPLVPRAPVRASRAHCSISRCPPFAAYAHVVSFHGQPFARKNFSTSRFPHSAARVHVPSSHQKPFSRIPFSISSCPFAAAKLHKLLSVFFVFPQVTVVQLTVLMHELQRA